MIAGKLVQLVDSSLDILESQKSNAKPMKVTFVKHKITKFSINEKSMRTQSKDYPYERDDWGLFLYELIRDHISLLPIFLRYTVVP